MCLFSGYAKLRLLHRTSLLIPFLGLVWIASTKPMANAATVIDQLGPLTTATSFNFSTLPDPTLSQIFSDFGDYSTVVLENFTLALPHTNITEVAVVFRAVGGFDDFSNVDGFLLNIYSDLNLAAASLSGDVASITATLGANLTITEIVDTSDPNIFETYDYGLLRFTLDLNLAAAGEYWIGVSPIGNTALGQFMLVASPVSGLGMPDAQLANPGEGHEIGSLSQTGNHHAISVTAIPEPGSASLLMLTGLSLVFMRRRNV